MTTVKARSYGVDIASYQKPDSSNYTRYGAKFVIVKLTQGTNYVNPFARSQISTAKAHGALPMGYFFATFSANSFMAQADANYACENAVKLGLPKGSYIAVDWEVGSGNVCNYKLFNQNTSAVIEAMKVIKSHGYKPLLYSGAYVMKSCLDHNKVYKEFGTCLWVASYPKSGFANFSLFPSMDGVAIWQFTDHWKGLGVDGNISLVKLYNGSGSQKEAKSNVSVPKGELNIHPVVKWNIERVFVVSNEKGAYLYGDASLKNKGKIKPFNSSWQVFGEKDGAIRVAKSLYFDGRAGFTKSNPIAHNTSKHGVVKVILPNTHALKSADVNAEKAYGLKLNAKYEIIGRVGHFLQLKTANGAKRYVSGNRAFIVL